MRLTPLLPLALLLGAGCAAAGSGSSGEAGRLLELFAWQAPAGQTCSVAPLPRGIGLETLFDTAAVVAAAPAVDSAGAVVVALATDSTGALTELRALDHTVPIPATEAVIAALRSAFLPQEPGERRFARVRMDLAPGARPTLELGGSQFCMPAIRNPEEIAAMVRQSLASARAGAVAEVDVRVGEAGEVLDVEMHKSSFHGPSDLFALAIAREARFHPARADRKPVPVWVRFPVRFVPPDERAGR